MLSTDRNGTNEKTFKKAIPSLGLPLFLWLSALKTNDSEWFLFILQCRNGPSWVEGPFLHLIDGAI